MNAGAGIKGRDQRDTRTLQQRVPALDGLRAVAVIAVLLFHSKFAWAKGGKFGVDVFFALSGYLITAILLSEMQKTGQTDFKSFYVRRSLRLMPALICVVIACCLVETLLGPYDSGPSVWTRAFWTLTYSSNWIWAIRGGDALGALNAPWSLAIEEQFYLVWPIVLIQLFRANVSQRTIGLVALAAAFGSVFVEILLTRSGASWFRIYAGSDVRGGVILLGCAFALLLPEIERFFTHRLFTVIGFCSVISLLFIFSTGHLHTYSRLMYFHRLEVGFFTLGLVAIALYDRGGIINGALSFRPLAYIGKISYGIYLWHGSANLYLARYMPDSPMWLRIGVGLALGVLSYHTVELYFLRLKGKWSKSDISAVPATQPA